MKKQFKLGVIGCGFWAQTILKGIVLSDFLRGKKILVCDTSEEKLEEVRSLGVRMCADYRAVAQNCEYVLFADDSVRIDGLNGAKFEKVICAVPNLRKNTVKNYLGTGTVKVARCVLNLPCSIGSGTVGVDMTDFNKSVDDTEFISNVLNCIGTVLSVDESKMDAVAGLSGNGSAYALMFLDALIDGGVNGGLSKNEAKILAVQTLLGTAELAEHGEKTLAELTMQACKGSAVMEAVKVLEQNNFRKTVSEAVAECIKRTKELSAK